MFFAYSVGLVVSMYLTSFSPRFFWAHWTPSQADWLKLLSSTLPTSVTRPTRTGLAPAAAGWLGQPGAAAAGAPVGAGAEAPWQADSTTASPLSSAAMRREASMAVECTVTGPGS